MGTRKLVVAGGSWEKDNMEKGSIEKDNGINIMLELNRIIEEMNTDSDKPVGLTFGDERLREVRDADVSCAFCYVFMGVGDSFTKSQSFLSKHGFQSLGHDFVINVGDIAKRELAHLRQSSTGTVP